jgi:hypothetical protein
MELLSVLKTELSRDQRMAIVSNGSPVEPDVQLALALRILGGGSHHDFAMLFRIATITVYAVFNATINAINNLLALPGVPLEDIEKLQKLAERFILSRWTQNPLFGVVGALEGIALKLQSLTTNMYPETIGVERATTQYLFRLLWTQIIDSCTCQPWLSVAPMNILHFPYRLGIALKNGGLPDGYKIAADAA